MLDEVHRLFINESLSFENIKGHFTKDDFARFYELWGAYQDKKTDSTKESFEKHRKQLCSKLKNCFDVVGNQWHEKYGEVLKTKAQKKAKDVSLVYSDSIFPILQRLVEEDKINLKKSDESGDDKELFTKEELLEFLKSFEKFHTYFSGFNENRENVYDCGKDGLKSTSIAHRLFEQNVLFHFQNVNSWEKIKKSIKEGSVRKKGDPDSEEKISELIEGWDWNELCQKIETKLEIEDIDEIFNATNILSCFTQRGICKYNKLIGGFKEDNISGINQIINLTLQKIKKEGFVPNRKQFPSMQDFYKQILSPSEKAGFMDEIDNDRSLLQDVATFRDGIIKNEWDEGKRNIFEHLQCEILKIFDEDSEQKQNYYLNEKSIQKISAEVTGNYNDFHYAWNDYVCELDEKELEHNYSNKQKCISFKDIELIYRRLKKQPEQNIEAEWRDDFTLKTYVKSKFEKLLKNGYSYYTKNKKITRTGLLKLIEDSDLTSLLDKLKRDEELRIDKSKEIKIIKKFLDSCLEFARFIKSFNVRDKDVNKHQSLDSSRDFLVTIDKLLRENFDIVPLYNNARNYIKKKNFSLDKIKLCFDHPNLANGWAYRTSDYNCRILKKNNSFYLLILGKKSSDENFSKNLLENYKIMDYDQIKSQTLFGSNWLKKYEKKMKDEDCGNKEMVEKILNLLDDLRGRFPDFSKKLDELKRKNENGKYDFEIKKAEIYELFEKKTGQEYSKYKSNHEDNKERILLDVLKNRLGNVFDYKKDAKYLLNRLNDKSDDHLKGYKRLTSEINQLEHYFYNVDFRDIDPKESEKLQSKELYLFRISNKDFSETKTTKSKKNLHTLYWLGLFEPENFSENVCFKLSGGAELFFRPPTLDKQRTPKHKKGSVLQNKNRLSEWEEVADVSEEDTTSEKRKKIKRFESLEELKKTEAFKQGNVKIQVIKNKYGIEEERILYKERSIGKIARYEIIKDKRFTSEKYFFHCPIELNFSAGEENREYSIFNQKINRHIEKKLDKVNIIGIDRGERNLLYYSVINQKGDILEQRSLNKIFDISYKSKLDDKERERADARENWETIENIKELKSGYLSQVVHELAKLIIEHDAIVVLEDLNKGFKTGRFKVEKQVYQKFEKALIDKLNYLCFKKKNVGEYGHYLAAFQLTAPLKSFEKLRKQSGILFYTAASYTSRTDPVTGYIRQLYPRYKSVNQAKAFFEKFEKILYNGEHFEFSYDLKNLKGVTGSYDDEKDSEQNLKNTEWTIHSRVDRSEFKEKDSSDNEKRGKWKEHQFIDVNKNLKELFKNNGLELISNKDYKQEICNSELDADFFQKLIRYFSKLLDMRVYDEKSDFIQSPVYPFYDSREAEKHKLKLPIDSDANGAYNIARKGIIILDKIKHRLSILDLCEPDAKGYKKWTEEKEKREVLSRTKEENKAKIEKIFQQWQKKR